MRFKLDENFGTRTLDLFRGLGHDAGTVNREGLSGCSDEHIFRTCIQESRCLVTLDLDFANVLRFPPHLAPGVAVLRLPVRPTLPVLEAMVSDLLQATAREPIARRLWVVEIGRIRVHEDTSESDSD
jgi:predicted nuclease of predicted toxin-antitoxin system